MGKVDRSLGRELRRRRIANGDTHDTLAAVIGVSAKTIGKWERGLVMPSATNIRLLEKLGLIEDWLGRNGSRNKQYGQSLENGRFLQAPGFPETEQQSGVQEAQGTDERELVALFRAFSAEEQTVILKILHMVMGNPARTVG